MRILFAGPSLAGSPVRPDELGLIDRGPAKQSDVVRAVVEGATAIGIVDGLYGNVAAVWHKEILFALSCGVHVLGAASIGALRAAECGSFGMVGLGVIFQRYASGDLDDDAAVAQLHAPADFGYQPLTEALVNVEATVDELRRQDRIDAPEARFLMEAGQMLHFTERTWKRLMAEAGRLGMARCNVIADLLLAGKVNLKQRDAERLVEELANSPDDRRSPPAFELSRTQMLENTLSAVRRPTP